MKKRGELRIASNATVYTRCQNPRGAGWLLSPLCGLLRLRRRLFFRPGLPDYKSSKS